MFKKCLKTTLVFMCVLAVLAVMKPGNTEASENGNMAVKIAEDNNLGKFLTDSEGMTLYYFTKDKGTTSACTGFCLERWPVFYVETPEVPMGIDMKDFTVITREDGTKQTAYKGRLLYYFNGDTKPGDTKGQGAFDSWYVVAP
jgi:predicted lipoprotein with Yx(FWY)xxD motif